MRNEINQTKSDLEGAALPNIFYITTGTRMTNANAAARSRLVRKPSPADHFPRLYKVEGFISLVTPLTETDCRVLLSVLNQSTEAEAFNLVNRLLS